MSCKGETEKKKIAPDPRALLFVMRQSVIGSQRELDEALGLIDSQCLTVCAARKRIREVYHNMKTQENQQKRLLKQIQGYL